MKGRRAVPGKELGWVAEHRVRLVGSGVDMDEQDGLAIDDLRFNTVRRHRVNVVVDQIRQAGDLASNVAVQPNHESVVIDAEDQHAARPVAKAGTALSAVRIDSTLFVGSCDLNSTPAPSPPASSTASSNPGSSQTIDGSAGLG